MNVTDICEIGFGEVFEIKPVRHQDERGFFSETYNARALRKAGIDVEFVQDNHSRSAAPGTLRGLHFQTPPMAQGKLVRVTSGEIFDVAVDIRHGSPTFGNWVGIMISADKWNQIYVPPGFAHGFLTLTANTEVIYKVTEFYSPEHDRSIRFDDPQIGIEWPTMQQPPQLSQKDGNAELLSQIDTGFVFSGSGN